MKRNITSFFLLFSVFQLHAQIDSIQELNQVIVTATRTPSLIQQLPFTVTIKNSKKGNLNLDRTVPEFLSGLPGIFIQKTNHGGGSPFVRGMTGNQNLILIDGFRLNNSIFRYGPNQYLTLIDPQMVDRIEIVKGTGSVQYGSDALGGVINIITYTPTYSDKVKWSPKVYMKATTAGMEKTIRPSFEYSRKKVALYFAASFSDFGDLKGGDSTGFQRPSGYKQLSVDTKVSVQLKNLWDIYYSITTVSQQDVPLYHRYKLDKFKIATSDPLNRYQSAIRVQKKFQAKVFRLLNFRVSLQRLNENRLSQSPAAIAITNEKDKVTSVSFSTDEHLNFTKNWTSTLSLEINRDNIFSKRELLQPTGQIDRRRGLYPDNSTYSHGAISNLHQLSFDKFRVDLGWRYHQYKINMFDTTLGSIAVSPRAIVYLMGVSFTPLSSISVFSNISSGYRAPNIDDMGTVGLIDFRYEVPAYDLKPEESLNKELGLRWNKQNISSTATVFHTAFRNLITRIKTDQVINNYPVYIKQNVEQAYIWGAEWTVDGIIHSNWKASANVTYLFGQNLTRKEPMRRIPPLTSNLSFQYSIKNHQVGVQLENANLQNRLAQGDKEDTRIPVGGTPGFSIWHLSVSGKLKAIQYRALLYNMFNRDFRTHGSGINGMGRAFTLSFSFIF